MHLDSNDSRRLELESSNCSFRNIIFMEANIRPLITTQFIEDVPLSRLIQRFQCYLYLESA